MQRQVEEEEVQTQPLQRAGWGATQETNAEEEEEVQTKPLQRTADGSFTAGRKVETQLAALRGTGEPLPAESRHLMEQRFGADFGGVRIHTGATAAQLSRDLQAQAFTHGQDIYFGAGRYDPGSDAGRRLLAHELTHTIQQTGGTRLHWQPEGILQAKLDPNVHSRAAYAQKGLKAGTKPFSTSSFGLVLKKLDQYYQADNRVSEKKLLQEILKHCQDWLTSGKRKKKKTGDNEKDAILKKLQIAAQKEISTIDATLDISLFTSGLQQEMLSHIVAGQAPTGKTTDTRSDQELLNEYNKLEPDLAQYAVRVATTASTFKDRGKLNILKKALSLPRGTNGELSPEAIYLMSVAAYEDAKEYIEGAEEFGQIAKGVDKKSSKVKKEVKESSDVKNPLTGRTKSPEMENILASTTAPDPEQKVVDTVTESGVSLQVLHSIVDVHYNERLTTFKAAVKKLATAGVRLPDLLVHLPKYGDKVSVSGSVATHSPLPRAVFVAPNYVHVRGDTVGNPLEDQGSGKKFKYLSTEILVNQDPSGAATVVHELGHLMHYQNAPGKFFSLSFTSLKSSKEGSTALKTAMDEVSGYGSNNPREFVAETFLGLIYGKNYSNEVLRMYRAFGGYPVPSVSWSSL